MKNVKPIKALKQTALIMALAVVTLQAENGMAGQETAATMSSEASLAGINIEYKMDPRITRGLYMGDRWIKPPTYTTTLDRVEIRASGVNSQGKAVPVAPQWIPSDPEMITVSPGRGKEVAITVKRAGESRLKVASEGVVKELAIKAAPKGDVLQMEIAEIQTEAPSQSGGTSSFKSEKEKINYALGMSLVGQLRRQGIELDADAYTQGLQDALSGSRTLLTEAEAQAVIADLQNNLKSKSASQAVKNKAAGEAFLATNKAAEGVVTVASGLQYKVLKAGDGPKPTLDDTVVCNYRGTLINGMEFDSSYKRNQPMKLALKKVIPGWREALQLMPVGSRWQIFIPSSLAYGSRQAGKIEPNSTLIFEVELISIQGSTAGSAAVPAAQQNE